MARIRSVHPGLASDEAYMSMSMAAKAAWPLLWTECDDQGLFEWKPIVLKARIFPADNIDFGEILFELESLGCVARFEVGGKSFGAVRNFQRYQRPKKPNSVHPLPKEFRTFVGLTPSSSEPVPHQSSTGTEKSPQMEDGGGRMEEEVSDPPLRSGSDTAARKRAESDFDEWYQAYPRHEDKGNARKAYRTALKKTDAATLLTGAKAAKVRYRGTQNDFIPLPATWLNGERWADEHARDGPINGARPSPKSPEEHERMILSNRLADGRLKPGHRDWHRAVELGLTQETAT